jgi:ADP-heptose:LPS heptosyltransferase
MAAVSPGPIPDRAVIVVLRALPGLGDWLCAVPALRALRRSRPDARIHLVALPATRLLVSRYAGLVDGFHAFPGWPGLPDAALDRRRVPGFLAAIQDLEPDLAIQLHGSGETTNEIVELFGARAVAGFFRPGRRCPDPLRFVPWRETEPEVRRGLTLLGALGVDLPEDAERLEFPLEAAGERSARALLRESGIDGPFVVVHPGGRRPAARWPAVSFGRVARELAGLGRRVVVTGLPDELPLTASVAAEVPAAIDLGGRTDLDTLGWLLRLAGLAVTNDTGISHLADALDVPSVVVFAADDGSRAARWAPLDADRHPAIGGSTARVSARARRLLRTVEAGLPDAEPRVARPS